MPRVRKGSARQQKHKKVLKEARGFRGAPGTRYRLAKQALLKAKYYATRDRRRRKRDFRSLWITRISAACTQRGLRYSELMYALEQADIELNRKMLSELAIADPAAFDAIVATAFPNRAQA